MSFSLRIASFLSAFAFVAAFSGCGDAPTGGGQAEVDAEIARIQEENAPAGKKMKLAFAAFDATEPILKRHTGEGEDLSPPLTWEGVPKGTKAFALLVSDPDAPSPETPADKPWIHWVAYDLPGDARELPEGVSREVSPTALSGGVQGLNSWPEENVGYRGPLPPAGSGEHRYVFTLYALDATLGLDPGSATYDAVLTAMRGRILDSATAIGRYEVK